MVLVCRVMALMVVVTVDLGAASPCCLPVVAMVAVGWLSVVPTVSVGCLSVVGTVALG